MGIPQFIGTLKERKYPGAFIFGPLENIKSLSLDFNSIIHGAAADTYGYSRDSNPDIVKLIAKADKGSLELQLFENIAKQIKKIVKAVKPKELLVLAVDGVVPFAKMQQQRERRYKATVKPSSPYFDSNCITPGTPFMERLDNYLQRWIYSSRLKLPPKIIYSGHLSPGEGEHKIFQMMRDNDANIYDPDGKHVVYGLDADLVVLSLLSKLNIYLLRNDVHDIVHINSLATGLVGDMKTPTAIEDFCFMVTLLGNDFIPRPVAVEGLSEGMEALMLVYRSLMIQLIGDEGIIYDNFKTFLNVLASRENTLLEDVSKKSHRYESRMFKLSITEVPIVKGIQKIFDPARFRDAWYINALRSQDNELAVTLSAILNLPADKMMYAKGTINDMCFKYFEGIEWIYGYYTQGPKSIDDKWFYPFFHAPLFRDLNVFSQSHDFLGTSQIVRQSTGQKFSVLHQILIVIPPGSATNINVVTPELTHLFTSSSSALSDDLPEGFPIEIDDCDEWWQFHALVPACNWYKVVQIVDVFMRNFTDKARLLDFQEVGDVDIDNAAFKNIYEKKYRTMTGNDSYIRGGSYQRGGRGGRGRGHYSQSRPQQPYSQNQPQKPYQGHQQHYSQNRGPSQPRVQTYVQRGRPPPFKSHASTRDNLMDGI